MKKDQLSTQSNGVHFLPDSMINFRIWEVGNAFRLLRQFINDERLVSVDEFRAAIAGLLRYIKPIYMQYIGKEVDLRWLIDRANDLALLFCCEREYKIVMVSTCDVILMFNNALLELSKHLTVATFVDFSDVKKRKIKLDKFMSDFNHVAARTFSGDIYRKSKYLNGIGKRKSKNGKVEWEHTGKFKRGDVEYTSPTKRLEEGESTNFHSPKVLSMEPTHIQKANSYKNDFAKVIYRKRVRKGLDKPVNLSNS